MIDIFLQLSNEQRLLEMALHVLSGECDNPSVVDTAHHVISANILSTEDIEDPQILQEKAESLVHSYVLEQLCKKGYVECLIGDEAEFKLTDSGIEYADKIMERA